MIDDVRPPVPGEDEEAWPDLAITLAPPLPRIAPGVYFARSIGFRRFERRGWSGRLTLYFEIYDRTPRPPTGLLAPRTDQPHTPAAPTILATLEGYFPMPERGGPRGPRAKLARVYGQSHWRPNRSAGRRPAPPA